MLATWKLGDTCYKGYLLGRWEIHVSKPISTSQWRQRFLLGGRWEQNNYMQTSTIHSDKAIDGPVRCVSSWLVIMDSWHPGFTSPWLHGLNISKSLGTGMLEGQGLYLLNPGPYDSYTNTLFISKLHIRVSTYRNTVKKWWSGLQFPVTVFHCYTIRFW